MRHVETATTWSMYQTVRWSLGLNHASVKANPLQFYHAPVTDRIYAEPLLSEIPSSTE